MFYSNHTRTGKGDLREHNQQEIQDRSSLAV